MRVMSSATSTVTFKRPDGKDCSGFYVEPAAGSQAPGVVIIQEWWGLNDQIKGVAQRFAASGYRALVPDLYRGQLGLDAKEAEHLMTNLNFADAAGQDIRGAVQYLKTSSRKVGVCGYCMGGALTLLSAVFVPEVDAAVTWYGLPPLDYIDASKITAPLQGHFAIHDAFFKIEQVDALEEKLKAAHARYTFYRYNAQHAFGNENNVNSALPLKYDPTATETAWTRTLEFFGAELGAAKPA
jgi:carboxymethylenebutenolidase